MGVRSLGRLRRFWFYVHLWIGVGLAALLIPLSASGSYLAWRGEIERAIHPTRYAVAPGPADLAPQAYLDAAQAAFGDRARASSLRLPAAAGDPVIVTGVVRNDSDRGEGGQAGQAPPRRPQTLTAWLDPSSARVLETANPREGLSMWMHDLHGQFFVFGTGRQVVGWFGVAMFVSCLTGLWLWWPRGGSVVAGLRWRRSPDLMINLHYLTGFWVAIPLAVLCLSGALIAFPQFTRGAVGAFQPVSAQPGRGPGGGSAPMHRTALTIDEAATRALQAQPNTALVSIDLPTRGRGAPSWRVQLRSSDGTARTLQVADATDGPVRAAPDRVLLEGDKLIRLNRAIHGGDGMALAWKWIITVAGLAPGMLGVTGVVVWARRQLRKARMRGRLAGPMGEPAPAE